MSETKQTPWLVKSYSAQLEQSANDIVTKIDSIASSIGESANWNSTYTLVSNSSANWNSVYDIVGDTSGKFNDGYDSLSLNSGNWNDTYNDFSKNSASYGSTYTNIIENSAKWNSVYNDFSKNSSTFLETYSTVHSNSASWGGQGLASVYTDGTTVSGDGTEDSKIGLIGPNYNLVAGDNISITPNGNDLVISSTGGGTATGDYLPLSGGTVSGTIVASGNMFYNQFAAIRLKDSTVHSAYFGAGSDGRAFIKSGLTGRPELSIYTDHILFTNDAGTNPHISAYVPFYNKDEVSNYNAFGFDKDGNPISVQEAGNYVRFVEQTDELKVQYLRAVQDAANIPETSENPTLWVVVSAVG